MARIVFYVFLVLFLSVGIDSRKSVGSGSRRTTSWGSSKPKPSTSTNTGFSHSNQDITRLSYGNHESAARSPPKSHDTHRPSAPSSDHKPSAPKAEDANVNRNWNTNQQNPGTNQQPGNIGWNVNQPGQNQPGQTGNIGWNTNQRPGQNTPNQQTHVNNVNAAPPPYPGAPPGYPVHGQAPPGYPTHGQPPPPYPGFAPHGQNVGPPPAYSGYQTHGRYDPPPAYGAPGYGAPGNYPRQGYPGYNQGGYGGYGGGGYGGYPGGGGYGMPGSPGLLGGFGGGGYGSNRGGSGFSGGSLLTGALLGYTLSNLLSNNHNQHYYYPNSRTVYSDNSNTNSATSNTQVHTVSGDKGTYATYVGNMTCISMYNAKEVSKWANATLQDFYASYPSQPFPMNLNSTTGGMNFTVIPGEIIHKEKLDVTCCGTNRGPVDLVELTNGKIKDINCLYQTFEMPFRKLTFIPVNNTDTNNTTTAVPTTPLPTNITTAVPSSTQEAQLTTNSTTETTINSEQTTVQS